MKRSWFLGSAVLLVAALAACAPAAEPTMITPTEQVTSLPYDEAYRLVISTINTQPYESTTSGWVIVNSDQVGGLVSAQLSGQHTVYRGLLQVAYLENFTARVSVVLVARADSGTSVSISSTREPAAHALVNSLREVLALQDAN